MNVIQSDEKKMTGNILFQRLILSHIKDKLSFTCTFILSSILGFITSQKNKHKY
jgi:hypothetical protein